jgi:hypothetical protein
MVYDPTGKIELAFESELSILRDRITVEVIKSNGLNQMRTF